MTRQIIHTERAPQAIGTYSQAVRVGDTVYLSGQVPLDPATMQMVAGDIEARDPARIREPQGGGGSCRGLAGAGGEGQRLPDRSGPLLQGKRSHGRSTAPSPTPRGPPSGSHSCRAARRSRSSASCTWGEGRRRSPSRPWTHPASVRSPPRAGSVPRLPSAWGSSASPGSRTFCLCCRCATRTARRSPRSASSTSGQRAAVEGEVLLTEVAYRGRRQPLLRISDGSGMLTLRFFYFSGARSGESCPRHARALFRRGAPRAAGT